MQRARDGTGRRAGRPSIEFVAGSVAGRGGAGLAIYEAATPARAIEGFRKPAMTSRSAAPPTVGIAVAMLASDDDRPWVGPVATAVSDFAPRAQRRALSIQLLLRQGAVQPWLKCALPAALPAAKPRTTVPCFAGQQPQSPKHRTRMRAAGCVGGYSRLAQVAPEVRCPQPPSRAPDARPGSYLPQPSRRRRRSPLLANASDRSAAACDLCGAACEARAPPAP
jgi:hypothetical protein